MKEYKFIDEEIDIIRYLKKETPKNIWGDLFQYVFEYEEFFIKLEIKCAEKLLVDNTSEESVINTEKKNYNILEQYVMSAKLSKVNSAFIPHKYSELLCSNLKIKEIYIVRTLLYFCKHRQSNEHKNLFSCDSYIINPNFKINEKLNVERTYLADIGLLLVFDDMNLNCFILDNDDDFSSNNIFQKDNLVDTKKDLYEFIKLE